MNPQTIGISVGNILGSNIANIGLILGIAFLIMAIKYPESAGYFTSLTRAEVGNLNFGIFIASIVPLILLYIGNISQLAGFLLVLLFFYNMYELIKKKESVEVISSEAETHKIGKYIVESALGIVGVVVSAYFIVESASFLALSIGIPPIVVGATVVAFGTSVPELATSIDAVRKGFIDLALGNVIGSCFINITLILGLTFLISPFNVNVSAFSDLVIFSLISNIVLWYILQNTKISKREGLILLAIYALFIAISFGRGSS
jgi:cation:H+ antiporter